MKIENVSCFSLAATTPFHRWISAAPGEEWGWEGRWSSCSCRQGWAISFACQIRLKIRLQTKFLSDLQNGSREWMHVSAFHHIHRNPVHSVHIWYSYTHIYIYIYTYICIQNKYTTVYLHSITHILILRYIFGWMNCGQNKRRLLHQGRVQLRRDSTPKHVKRLAPPKSDNFSILFSIWECIEFV